MILTNANLLAHMKEVGETRIGALCSAFAIYDSDAAKRVKLHTMMEKLIRQGHVKVEQEDSAATTVFGAAIVRILNLPSVSPKYVYIGG